MVNPDTFYRISKLLNDYTQPMGVIEGPLMRKEIDEYLNEHKELHDNEFILAIHKKYGAILNYQRDKKLLIAINTIKVILIISLISAIVVGLIISFNF